MKIKSLKKGYSQVNLIYFDVETKFSKGIEKDISVTYHTFKVAVVKNNEKRYVCYSKDELTEKILELCIKRKRVNGKRKRVKNIVFAHNADYDFRFLNWDLILNKYDITNKSMKPFFVDLREKRNCKRKTNILILDSLNWFKASLKKLGDIFGLKKFDINFESCSMKELIEYCKRDVDILEKVVEFLDNMHKEYDIWWTLSIAQMTYRIFRKHFLDKTLFSPNIDDIMKLERNSYKGGRVEVFDLNRFEEIFKYDINSLYPYIMKTSKVPIKLKSYYSKKHCDKLSFQQKRIILDKELKQDKLIIVEATIEEYSDFPTISVRKEGKLIFPNGRFKCYLTTNEYLKVKDKVKDIHQFSVYHGDLLFRKFVDTFYSKRNIAKANKNKVMSYFYKILLNSLYGKFGQRRFEFKRFKELDDFKEFGIIEHIDAETFENHHVHYFLGKAFKKEIYEDNPRAFVAIASHITANARLELYKYIQENKDKIVYCDTDSVFLTEQRLENNYNDSKTLGGMKFEGTLKNFKAYGCKDYEGFVQGKLQRKLKGVPKSATLTKENQFKYSKVLKHRETIHRFKDMKMREVKMTKNLKRDYDKRIVNKDKSTKPLLIK
jgi:hypothetical protein